MACGLEGQTQAAHSNQLMHGKARGQKAADCYVAALCFGCHHTLDQGKTLSKEERRNMWQSAFDATLLWLWENGRLAVK